MIYPLRLVIFHRSRLCWSPTSKHLPYWIGDDLTISPFHHHGPCLLPCFSSFSHPFPTCSYYFSIHFPTCLQLSHMFLHFFRHLLEFSHMFRHFPAIFPTFSHQFQRDLLQPPGSPARLSALLSNSSKCSELPGKPATSRRGVFGGKISSAGCYWICVVN